MLRKMSFFILALCVCVAVLGCAETIKKVETTDQWMQDNMW